MKTKQFHTNKLVRDRSIEHLDKQGVTSQFYTLDTEQYNVELRRKLSEETAEILEATNRAELLEEIADVFEVLYALAKTHDATPADIEAARSDKYARWGGFEKRIYSERISMAADNPKASYFQAKSHKYPEIASKD